MKNLFCALVFLQFCLCCISQDKLFVGTNGSDNNPGTLVKPFRTVEAALNKITSAKGNTVSIFLRAGRYAVAKTIEITPSLLNHHQLMMRSYNNEPATFTGAIKISSQWKPHKGNILQTSIGARLSIDQLFCNGKPL